MSPPQLHVPVTGDKREIKPKWSHGNQSNSQIQTSEEMNGISGLNESNDFSPISLGTAYRTKAYEE